MTATASVKGNGTGTVTGEKGMTEIEVGIAIVTGSAKGKKIETTRTESEISGIATAIGTGIGREVETANAIEAAKKGTIVTCAPKVTVIGADTTHLRALSVIATDHFPSTNSQRSLAKKRPPSLLKRRPTAPR